MFALDQGRTYWLLRELTVQEPMGGGTNAHILPIYLNIEVPDTRWIIPNKRQTGRDTAAVGTTSLPTLEKMVFFHKTLNENNQYANPSKTKACGLGEQYTCA